MIKLAVSFFLQVDAETDAPCRTEPREGDTKQAGDTMVPMTRHVRGYQPGYGLRIFSFSKTSIGLGYFAESESALVRYYSSLSACKITARHIYGCFSGLVEV